MADEAPPRVAPKGGARPEWGPWGEPAFVVVAGESGTGKSTDLCLSFAGEAIFAALPGGTKPAWSMGRVDLEKSKQRRVVRTLEEGTKLALYLGEHPELKIGALGIDDLSLLLKNTYDDIARRDPPLTRKGEIDGYEVWDRVGWKLLEFANTARSAGLHVACNCHLRGPETDNKTGVYYKGGPDMPSRKLTKLLPHFADVVYLTSCEPGRAPWHGVYRCIEGDPEFHMKDRHHVITSSGPMNLREILISVGYQIRRPRGLEWMDDVAETIAGAILDAKMTPHEICARAAHNLFHKQNRPIEHVQWAVHRDGQDRATLRLAQRARLSRLGIGATDGAGPVTTAPAAAGSGGLTLS